MHPVPQIFPHKWKYHGCKQGGWHGKERGDWHVGRVAAGRLVPTAAGLGARLARGEVLGSHAGSVLEEEKGRPPVSERWVRLGRALCAGLAGWRRGRADSPRGCGSWEPAGPGMVGIWSPIPQAQEEDQPLSQRGEPISS